MASKFFDFFNHEGFTDYGFIEYHEERNIVGFIWTVIF